MRCVAFEEAVERFEADAGFFDRRLVEQHRAAVVGAEQEEADAFAALALDEVGEAAGAFGAAHFAADGFGRSWPLHGSPVAFGAAADFAGGGAGAQQAVVGPVA